MDHLSFQETPITHLPYFSKKYGINLFSKRDDLFLEGAGGNKARMLQYLLYDLKNYDVLVTAGGPCSNFNRACALMCAKLGVPMHLVEYTDNPEEYEMSLNYFICTLCEIRKTRCGYDDVASTIEKVLNDYKCRGLKAKFIYAGGKSLEGFYAFYDAVRGIKEQRIEFDHVFLACGTGTTLTGICAGMQEFYSGVKVHAISVARKWESEKTVLDEDMSLLNDYLKSNYDFSNLSFYDEFLCGGYSKYSEQLFSVIKESISNEGMIIDPTYSGKAFYGMTRLFEQSKAFKGERVLFWNTGGLFNLLSIK